MPWIIKMSHILTMDPRIEAIPSFRYQILAVFLGFSCHILQSPQKSGLLHHFCRKICFSSSPRNRLFRRVLLPAVQMAGPVYEIKKMFNKNILIKWKMGFVKNNYFRGLSLKIFFRFFFSKFIDWPEWILQYEPNNRLLSCVIPNLSE